jgi:hypothetical protein
MNSNRILVSLLTSAATWLGVSAAMGETVPGSNVINYATCTGVESKPTRTTVYTNLTLIDATGATDVTAAIQTALNNCLSNQIVKLPEGIFRVDSALTVKTHTTLQGSGSNSYIRAAANITTTGGGGLLRTNISSGYTRGSTSITLVGAPNAGTLTVGSTMMVIQSNDVAFVTPCGFETPVVSCETYLDEPDNGTKIMGQMVRVTEVSGSTITFTPALYWEYSASLTPQILYPSVLSGPVNLAAYVGIENLTITNASSEMIRFERGQNCWISNVNFHIGTSEIPAVRGYWSHRVEVEHCYFEGWTAGAVAANIYVNNDGWRMEDNIFKRVNQALLIVGRGSAHAFAYNCIESVTNGTTAQIGECGTHGGHPMFIDWECNVLWKFHADSIHGSASHQTLLRNNIRLRKPGATFGAGGVWIDHTNWHNAVVGNVFGFTGLVTNDVGWTYEYSSDGTDDDTGNPGGILLYAWDRSGYNNHTANNKSKTSTYRHGNYDYLENTVKWDAGNADHAITNSLLGYVDGVKPKRFGFLRHPAIDPAYPEYSQSITNIPAGYRLTFGTNPPPESASSGPTPQVTGTAGGSAAFGGNAEIR